VLKRPWPEADQAPPSSAEVKNECSHAFTRPHIYLLRVSQLNAEKNLPAENVYS